MGSNLITKLLGILGGLFFCCAGVGTVVIVIINISIENTWLFMLALSSGLVVGIFGIITIVKACKYI
jgi:hypothetical protein